MFRLSREAISVTDGTLLIYDKTLGKFVKANTALRSDEVEPRHVREWLASLRARGCKKSYIHLHARAIKTFLRFLHAEGYADEVRFDMPPLGEETREALDGAQVLRALTACHSPRDTAMVLLLVDTGLRLSEALALRWGDVDPRTGQIVVRRGKGGKTRVVAIGARTRRAMERMRSTDDAPVLAQKSGAPVAPRGLHSVFVRLSKKSGVHVTAHILRRTFATLSLRAGMSPLHLQKLMGHSTLEMTQVYVRMVSDDLLEAHRQFGPIDRLK